MSKKRLVAVDNALNTDLMRPVNGSGGFQDLLRRLQRSVRMRRTMEISAEDVKRLRDYCKRYGEGGFQGRLRKVIE